MFQSSNNATEQAAEWYGWILYEAQLYEYNGKIVSWKNSLRDLVESREVEKEHGNKISLYHSGSFTKTELAAF